jgi:selenocysteine-specific elongation factor
MITCNFILATAGHVDHGKSSLVKALTGTDPDRLPEEKARGITIDLGFAHLQLKGTAGAEPVIYNVGIVDVPGHEDFVKNMVAGVGSIDVALLTVAADDCWMPQTEEHLQILSYLGVARAVVALTKIDLAQNESEAIREVRERLANSPFADAPIVPTSVVSGRGLEDLKKQLSVLLENTPTPRDIGKPRLAVDRVFTLRGIGTVVTGTTTGGCFHRGEEIVVQPIGARGRIRSVQNHNRDMDSSAPGTRTALNIPDLKDAPRGIQRGDVITLPTLGASGTVFDAVLTKSVRLRGSKSPAARPLKDGTRVRVHLGSSDVAAHVILLGERQLESGNNVLAQLRCEAPLYTFTGDRFIIRDWSEQATLAGGIVLDPDPETQKLQSTELVTLLQIRAATPDDVRAILLSEIAKSGFAPKQGLLTKSRFSDAEIREALGSLKEQGAVILAADWALHKVWWEKIIQTATERIEDEHRAHPNRVGLSLPDLKIAIASSLPSQDLFDLVLREIAARGYAYNSTIIRRNTHQISLPANLQASGSKLRAVLSAKPFDPPSRKETAPDRSSQQALDFLLETGEATLLSEDVVLLTDAITRAGNLVKEFLQQNKSATASELRQLLGTSRRVVIPLLEHFDKQGLTRREGDKRVLAR